MNYRKNKTTSDLSIVERLGGSGVTKNTTPQGVVSRVEHTGVEPVTSTLPVSRSSQMSIYKIIFLQPAENHDDGYDYRGHILHHKEDGVVQPLVGQGAAVGELVHKILPAEFPADEYHNEESAQGHQQVGRYHVEEVEESLAEDVHVGEHAAGEGTQGAEHQADGAGEQYGHAALHPAGLYQIGYGHL